MKRALLIALVLVTGCEKKKGQPSGIGKWRLATSTNPTLYSDLVKAKEGICSKDTSSTGKPIIYCHQLTPIKVGSRTATVDLYFDGHADDAKLVEIQLGVRGCIEDELDRWIRSALGPPIETRATRGYWQNDFIWVAALMPSDPARCLVHVLPASEKSEIERLKQK